MTALNNTPTGPLRRSDLNTGLEKPTAGASAAPVRSPKVALVHASFMLYWVARVAALDRLLSSHGAELSLVEISGDAGPYAFSRSDGPGVDRRRHLRLHESAKIETLDPTTLARRIWQALDELDPDAVICSAIAYTAGAASIRWAATRGRGVVVMDSARLVDFPRPPWVNAVKRRFFANAHAVLIPAPTHAASYEHFGLKREQIFFGVDAVDNAFFSACAAEHRAAGRRRVGGLELPTRYFFGVGRQVPKKNWLTLIDAYARYRRETALPPWDLVLVGDGPGHAKIVERVAQAQAPGVHLLPFLSPDDMCVAYANAGALVLPSTLGETWGLVVNEAMACGVAVLVSEECGCAKTLVEPDANGWTFAPRDVPGLAGLLERFASTPPQTREKMGRRSADIIAEWSVDRFAAGAWGAVQQSLRSRRGFASPLDRLLLPMWNGRFRPT